MNERRLWLLTMLLAAVPGTGMAQVRRPVSGKDFMPLPAVVPVEAAKGKIEVVEFFRYDCPHCNAFEPVFDAWARKVPDDVVVRRIPVAFDEGQIAMQRLFYALEAMDALDKWHGQVFRAIHVEHVPMRTAEQMAKWVEKQGLDRARFESLFSSFTVSTKSARALQLAKSYRLAGVPSLGVAGRFLTDGEMAGDNVKALFVAEYLIAEVRRGR
jgi:thiol:disulfide interchange protein DsbA